MLLFDLHCHTSGISRCCCAPAPVILQTAKDEGFDGIVLTNHYYEGYLDGRSYNAWLEDYLAEYEYTRGLGEKLGVKTIFGVEVTMNCNPSLHILLYGADREFLYNHPLYTYSVDQLYRYCKENGVCMVQAHPYRGGLRPLGPVDGYEINCHPKYVDAHTADLAAINKKSGILITCGCDYHHDVDYRPHGGVFLPENVTDEKVLAKYLLTTKEISLRVHEINAAETHDMTLAVSFPNR